MKRLHWSLDYSHQSTEQDFVGEFSQILSAALSASPIEPEGERKRHRYALLPGWRSFFRENSYSDSGIQIGHGIIDRRIDGRGTWWYHIEHVNSASGEELTLEFSGADAPERPLRDTWSIRARNSADGAYSSISWKGTFEDVSDGSRDFTHRKMVSPLTAD